VTFSARRPSDEDKEGGVRKFIPIAFLVAGLTLILCLAVPNILAERNRSRQKRTMADIRSIATAWEARATDTNSYSIGERPEPGVAGRVELFEALQHVTLEQLAEALEPKYIRKLPREDGWGRTFDIRIGAFDDKGNAGLYAIRSAGSDEKPDSAFYEMGLIADYSGDLIFSNGTFIRYPEVSCV
jgi:general secretion pathway protein G